MKIIGLTGGIASGKSTVTSMLRENGYTVIDTDKIAWQLSEPQQPLWQAYFARYGTQVINADASLNRQAVASIVFASSEEKAWMDSTAHPMIRSAVEQAIESAKKSGEAVVFLDVPLLYEVGWDKMADVVWLVYVDEQVQLNRLMARNNFAEAEAKRRIAAQMPMREKRARAEIVIDNNGSLTELEEQVKAQLAKL